MASRNSTPPSAASLVFPWFTKAGVDPKERLNFRELLEVSDAFTTGYLRLVRKGASKDSVGAAMLCATVNVYDVFELQSELPGLLRELADVIETGTQEPEG